MPSVVHSTYCSQGRYDRKQVIQISFILPHPASGQVQSVILHQLHTTTTADITTRLNASGNLKHHSVLLFKFPFCT